MTTDQSEHVEASVDAVQSRDDRSRPSQCLNCDAPLSGRYCCQCGQEARAPLAKLGVSFSDLAQEFASLDNRVLRTLRGLLLSPGQVTRQYVKGRRASYTPPFRLYLGVSAVLIALMTLTGLVNIETAISDLTPNQRVQLEDTIGIDLTAPGVAGRFDDRFNTFFPLLNLLTPLGLALALKAVMPRRLFHEHAIAGLHIATSQVLITSVLLPLTLFGQNVQIISSLFLIVGLSIHFWLFLRHMYSDRSTLKLFATLALAYTLIGGFISSAALVLVIKTL